MGCQVVGICFRSCFCCLHQRELTLGSRLSTHVRYMFQLSQWQARRQAIVSSKRRGYHWNLCRHHRHGHRKTLCYPTQHQVRGYRQGQSISECLIQRRNNEHEEKRRRSKGNAWQMLCSNVLFHLCVGRAGVRVIVCHLPPATRTNGNPRKPNGLPLDTISTPLGTHP